jgi:hypothetical protein
LPEMLARLDDKKMTPCTSQGVLYRLYARVRDED